MCDSIGTLEDGNLLFGNEASLLHSGGHKLVLIDLAGAILHHLEIGLACLHAFLLERAVKQVHNLGRILGQRLQAKLLVLGLRSHMLATPFLSLVDFFQDRDSFDASLFGEVSQVA